MTRGRLRNGLALALACALVPAAHAGAGWDYQGELGPERWAQLRPAWAVCGKGQRQSPIDIPGGQQKSAVALEVRYHAQPLRVVNDGHTVRVRFAPGNQLVLGKQALALQQFHFHLPGGDMLRGEAFPMAMHLLHRSASGQLVSVVVWFRQGAANAALAALLPHLPVAGQAEATVAGVMADAKLFMPADLGYYAFDGSLTAPPCTEGVRWLVMKQPLSASAEQLRVLGKLFPPNARPVQPLHGRTVTEGP